MAYLPQRWSAGFVNPQLGLMVLGRASCHETESRDPTEECEPGLLHISVCVGGGAVSLPGALGSFGYSKPVRWRL